MRAKKMIKVKVAIPCKDSADKVLFTSNSRLSEDIGKLKSEGIADVDIEVISNNTLTLTEFGNVQIEKCKDSYDYLILMHADVDFSIYEFIVNVIKTNGRYDIIGFAGTKKLFISQSPLTWFTGSAKFPDDRYGTVIHDHGGIMLKSFFNKNKPNVLDTEVITIDGLMMCLSKKAMQTENARFDEQFTYDFYDLDFCLNVQLKTNLKIGVIVQEVVHMSLGKSVLTEEFLVPERKFRAKYSSLTAKSQ